MIVYLDGNYVKEEEAKISFLDRGFLLGDGLYATIQVKEGVPLFLKTHLERLQRQAYNFGIETPPLQEEWVNETIAQNSAFTGVYKLKVVLTGGDSLDMGLPRKRQGHVIVFLKPFTVAPYAPLSLTLYPYPILTPHSSFKSLAHLGRYCIMEYAREKGFDDAVTTTGEGIVLEASFANLFWIEGSHFYTPDPQLPYHFGVTIGEMVQVAKECGFETHFTKKGLSEIPKSAFVFRVNTMSGIRPVVKIETRPFERALSLETRLLEAYERKVNAFHSLQVN